MRQGNNGRRPRGGRPNRRPGPLKSQTFDSNGPDVRIRGNAHQVYEKYLGLARDAMTGGDRVLAESYYQFAEHYYRIIHESTDPDSPGSHRPHFRDPRYEDRDDRDWQDGDFDSRGGEDSTEGATGGAPQGGHAQGNQSQGAPSQGGQQAHQQRPRDDQRAARDDRRPPRDEHRAPREEQRSPREETGDEDRSGLERTLGGGRDGQPRGDAGETNGQGGRAQGGPGQNQGREFRNRNRFRRRYQGTEEAEAASGGAGRRPFPPREDEAEPAKSEPVPADGNDEG